MMLKIKVDEDTFEISGDFPIPDVLLLIKLWFSAILRPPGATPEEQAALAARAQATADKLETADKALTELGKEPTT